MYIQPPYSFPNTRWPNLPDPSFIAAFMTEQSFVFVGESRVSNVWYRVLARPSNPNHIWTSPFDFATFFHNGQRLKVIPGRVEDPELLDAITKYLTITVRCELLQCNILGIFKMEWSAREVFKQSMH